MSQEANGPDAVIAGARLRDGDEVIRLRLAFKLLGQVVSGATLDNTLENLYEYFRGIIPYDRIGFSLIDERRNIVRARWVRSRAAVVGIGADYSMLLSATSLSRVAQEGRPRILNDLGTYLLEHPNSEATRLLLSEGMASSLTCPLMSGGRAIGFLFFSSIERDAYRDVHVGIYEVIAAILASVVEKALLAERNVALIERQERILAMVSHDLKVPLSVVKGYASFVHDEPPEDVEPALLKKAMHGIVKASVQMEAIIDDLLDTAGLDYGSLELRCERLDLCAFLHERHSFHALMAAEKNVFLELRLSESLPAVRVDPSRLKQVIDNLVSNATKYTASGSRIRIGAAPVRRGVLVSVIDQGPGIPADELERIFGEFARGRKDRVDDRRSVGLGLYIAKSLLRAHGIELRVRTRPGRGSAFGFLLPRHDAMLF